MDYPLAYCTNVHAGADLARTFANLERYALAVKARFAPEEPMGVGLWLAASAARDLRDTARRTDFADWICQRGLVPFTLNGFPYGDFHETVVKHRVYQPTWWEPARIEYTLDLIAILDSLLPPGKEGSISTLPIAWGSPPPSREQLRLATRNLIRVAEHLAELEQQTGRLIYVCLEPEPGCVLQRGEDVVKFFGDELPDAGAFPAVRRYLRVCHDICHSAVMFEDQRDVLTRYAQAGISVGKLQVSSAVCADFEGRDPDSRAALHRELSSFVENRYLHQTTVCRPNGECHFYEDLTLALQLEEHRGQWRVHFHVPIYLAEFGQIATTREDILRCLAVVGHHPELRHWEVETYAWSVLPAELQQAELAEGIAAEMRWLAAQIGAVQTQ
jgi:hypothetical protein